MFILRYYDPRPLSLFTLDSEDYFHCKGLHFNQNFFHFHYTIDFGEKWYYITPQYERRSDLNVCMRRFQGIKCDKMSTNHV